MYYTQSLNIRLLMNLGAHIGHAKIDWNTDNNALLAGLTNNNYILFNINKTLFYFKRCLIFMYSIGYNNGKFVIYYPGDDPFYRLMMETALDKDGLLPTKYPFIHSLVKPGFFSNWRVNYKRLVRQFYKVIFWNPHFFSGMTTQFVYDKLNEEVLKKGVNSHNLAKLRSISRSTIQAMTMPLKIFKRMRKPHYRAFKPIYKIHNKIVNYKHSSDSNFKLDYQSLENKFYNTVKLSSLSKYRYSNYISLNNTTPINKNDTVFRNELKNLYELKRNIFMKQTNTVERLFLSIRYYGGHPHFIIYKTFDNLPMCCFNSIKTTEIQSFIKMAKPTDLVKLYKHNMFGQFIHRFVPFNSKVSKEVLRCYFYLRSTKDDLHCRKFLTTNPLKKIVTWSNYVNIVTAVKKKIPKIQRNIEFKKRISSLNTQQLKKRNESMYYKKLGITNKHIFTQYFRRINNSGFNNGFKLKNHSDKIHTNMSRVLNRSTSINHKKIINYKNNKVRTESLKMLYYNLYNLLVMISMRNITYNNNNDDLTPYEQKYFKRFVKFILIFRYLKRIKSVPSAILLLNSDIHESQYTDFKSLNTSVIGLVDSNIQFTSLSYFIPTNDDNILLFLYYVKVLTHTYTTGRKHSLMEHLTPKFTNNIASKLNYSLPFIYQYKDKLSKEFQLLPFGSILDKLHLERLDNKRKEREKREAMFKQWEQEKMNHWKKKLTFKENINTLNRKNLFDLNKILKK